MQCPQCSSRMREIAYEGAAIFTCDGCGGEFIGAEELAHIVQSREKQFPEAEGMDFSQIKPQFGMPVSEKRRTLKCPQCQSAMTVGNYCGDSGVFIDRCEQCGGIWLDQDELEHVQILMEHWADEAPEQIQRIAGRLEEARKNAARSTSNAFSGSRFAFINALINRFLDAA